MNLKPSKDAVQQPYIGNDLSPYKKKEKITGYVRKIMETLGLDMEDDSLRDTPKRIAKMYVEEIFSGLNEDNFPKIAVIENKFQYQEPLIECNITLNSTCEHHFIPIIGVAHVAYVPKDKVIGLSKLNRIVRYYAKRPQVQERLTLQIAEKLKELLETDDVAVIIDGIHTCVRTRGIEDSSSITRTITMQGHFDGYHGQELLRSLPRASEFKL